MDEQPSRRSKRPDVSEQSVMGRRRDTSNEQTLNDVMNNFWKLDDVQQYTEPREPQVIEIIPENALVQHEDGSIEYKRFRLTRIGLILPEDTTQEEWQDVGTLVKNIESSVSWLVADWAGFANLVWGYSYEDIGAHFGYEPETLMSYVSIARAIPTLIRNQGLSFSHHRLVANLDEDNQRFWLSQALANGWTIKQMKQAMQPKALDEATPPTPLAKFSASYTTYAKQQLRLAQYAPPNERQQMAEMLRQLAQQIENL